MAAKKTVRATVWTPAERLALLTVWRDEDIEGQLQGIHRNMPLYSHLATLLADQGYERTAEQCRNKLKQIKSDFTKIKEQLSRSGTSGGRRGTFTNEEWEILTVVLGTRPIHNPCHLVDTMAIRNDHVSERDDHAHEFEDDDDHDRATEDTDMPEPWMEPDNTSFNESIGSVDDHGDTTIVDDGLPRPESRASTTSSTGSNGKGRKRPCTTQSINDFTNKKKNSKTDQISSMLTDFLRNQEESQAEFRRHEAELMKQQLQQEKELRDQEFKQNMEMMRTMAQMFASRPGPTQSHTPVLAMAQNPFPGQPQIPVAALPQNAVLAQSRVFRPIQSTPTSVPFSFNNMNTINNNDCNQQAMHLRMSTTNPGQDSASLMSQADQNYDSGSNLLSAIKSSYDMLQ